MRHPARLLDVGVLNCRRTRALESLTHLAGVSYAAVTPMFLCFIQVPALSVNSQGLKMWNSSRISHSQQARNPGPGSTMLCFHL